MTDMNIQDQVLTPGQTVMTRGVALWTQNEDHIMLVMPWVAAQLSRHLSGDWGDLPAEDQRANLEALTTRARVFSSYKIPDHLPKPDHDTKIWIVSEADRSATTILFPSEY